LGRPPVLLTNRYNSGMSQKIPIVAIVGRANVGKSSLFNALVGRREAIVAKEAGTTRDNVTANVNWQNKNFWLVDTAGLKDAADDFELSIQDQIRQAADSADVILVVVEADVPPTAEDRAVATMALKSRQPVLLAVNKIDKNRQAELSEWLRLGIPTILATSTTQKDGLEELLEAVGGHLPPARIKEDSDRLKVALLGRPNVGKSSLFNSLAKKQQAPWNARSRRAGSVEPIPLGQALVAAQSGTTRDVNRAIVNYHQKEIELMDTAGIRRSGRIERGVEHFSVLRALAAIEEADVGLLLMDVNELNVQLDQKIAGLVKEAGKGLILVVSKWDMAEAINRDKISQQIAANYPFVFWAPLIFTSAVTGQNVTKIFDLVLEIDKSRRQKIATPQLNRWLQQAANQHPPAGVKGNLPKLNYMVQEEDQDFPNFKIFGAHTKFIHWSYKRYLEHSFREQWPLTGTPIKFWFIEKS